MTEYDDAKQRIAELVSRFERAHAVHLKEADTKSGFIEPLFQALGWDTANLDEVRREENVSGGRADYAFRLGGTTRFYLEAKGASEDLDREDFARQAINYAWLKGCTWSVLTNFRALRVFNAERLHRDLSIPRTLTLSYRDYDAQFEKLWMLSRESTASAILDREAAAWGKRTQPEPVREKLLATLMDARQVLFKNLRQYNAGRPLSEIDEAVQRILDRFIFMRTVEDRKIEKEHDLQALVNGYEAAVAQRTNYDLVARMQTLFRQFDDGYDSRLFAEHFLESLVCEPGPFVHVVSSLYNPNDYTRFSFDAIDADVLGAVYEQYLGHVAQVRGKRVVELESKQGKRKSQGIYYTPQFVVKYIVQQTLGRYLREHTEAEARSVRVLDPACGSGSFLIEAFDVLDEHLVRIDHHSANDPEWSAHAYARRQAILLGNLYGVDLDQQAVEVAQLNLLLRAVNQREKLPMLNHICRGNSLVNGSEEELAAAFGPEYQEQVHPFTWEEQCQEAMGAGGFDVVVGNPPYVRIQTLPKPDVAWYNEHYAAATGNYDIYTLFVERGLQLLRPGGVLGMILPNKFMQASYGKGLRKLLSDHKALARVVDFGDQQVFEGATTYTCLLFLQKGGSDRVQFVQIADLGAWREKEDGAGVQARDVPSERLGGSEWSFPVGESAGVFDRLAALPVRLGDVADIFVGLQTSADGVFLFKEFQDLHQGEVEVFSKALGRKVRLEPSLLKRVVRSGDVGRYSASARALVLFPYNLAEGKASLLSPADLQRAYPLSWDYLQQNQSALAAREHGKFADSGWYQLYPKNLSLWERAKLLVPYMITRLGAYLDEGENLYFVNVTTGGFGLTSKRGETDLRYLTGLMNSRLLDFALKSMGSKFHGGYFAANKQFIERLPIRSIDFSDPADRALHDRLTQLVEEMLRLKRDYAAASAAQEDRRHTLATDIERVDRDIDALVYRLYGLTDAEIAIVEEGDPASGAQA